MHYLAATLDGSNAPSSQPHSRLLTLPAELRNAIYMLALPHEQLYHPARGLPLGISPPVSRANRRLRHETLPMFLARNHFSIPANAKGHAWLSLIGDENIRHIPRLCLQDDSLDLAFLLVSERSLLAASGSRRRAAGRAWKSCGDLVVVEDILKSARRRSTPGLMHDDVIRVVELLRI